MSFDDTQHKGDVRMDSLKLKHKMLDFSDNIVTLAKALKINAATLSNKINGKSEFTLSEIREIAIRYQLTENEIVSIFFPDTQDIKAS